MPADGDPEIDDFDGRENRLVGEDGKKRIAGDQAGDINRVTAAALPVDDQARRLGAKPLDGGYAGVYAMKLGRQLESGCSRLTAPYSTRIHRSATRNLGITAYKAV